MCWFGETPNPVAGHLAGTMLGEDIAQKLDQFWGKVEKPKKRSKDL